MDKTFLGPLFWPNPSLLYKRQLKDSCIGMTCHNAGPKLFVLSVNVGRGLEGVCASGSIDVVQDIGVTPCSSVQPRIIEELAC